VRRYLVSSTDVIPFHVTAHMFRCADDIEMLISMIIVSIKCELSEVSRGRAVFRSCFAEEKGITV
jgi:hypothetical protein